MRTPFAAAVLLFLILLAIFPRPARGELDQLRQARYQFDYGKYEEALKLVEEMQANKLLASEEELTEAFRIHGLANLYLGRRDEARSSFVRLLSIDPDFALDPLLVPPLAVAELDSVKQENAELLAPIRERRRAIAEQKRLEASARARLLEEEERKRREKENGPVVLQRVERHSFLINFLPFGAAQLEQGRSRLGAMLAIGQGLGLAGTVLTYSQVRSYIGSDGKLAPGDLGPARGWRSANWIVFGATAALYLGGMLDAVLNYQEETISFTAVPREMLVPPGQPEPAAQPAPTSTFFFAPVEGGAAAGLAGSF